MLPASPSLQHSRGKWHGKTWLDVFVFADETAENAAADDIKNTSLGSTSSNFLDWDRYWPQNEFVNEIMLLPFLIALSLPR